MKRSAALLFLTALCASLPAMAQAPFDIDKIYRDNDTNRDGFITPAEVRTFMTAYFKTLDLDGNGLLSKSELNADIVRNTGTEMPIDIRQRVLDGAFALYDFNADGRVDAESYIQAQTQMMMSADFNKDGKVSLEEKRALHEQRAPRPE